MTSTDQTLTNAIEITLIPGVGLQTQARLWQLDASLKRIFSMQKKELQAAGLGEEATTALHSRRYRTAAEEIREWAVREKCRILTRGLELYPALLAQISDPPLVLYAHGALEVLESPCVAIVGTRSPTCYGLQMAQGLAADLAERGVAIVSGLARGIDAAAHRGCLEARGATIAVLGCGIDVVYPRDHRKLTQQILERGLLLSEFPPGTSPAPQNFPVRNRVISGLAFGTVIVEAREYSGSLITARLAMEQNREVLAIPGNLTAPQSFGPNYLIQQGARLVQSWRDIVEEFPAEVRRSLLAREEARPHSAPQLELLDNDEVRLLRFLETDRATQFDRLFRATGFEISRLSNLLLTLEMRGLIRQLPGNLYLRLVKPVK